MLGIIKNQTPLAVFLALSALALSGCEVGSATKGKSPYRAPASTNSAVNPSANSAEVATAFTVSVAVKDRNGYGIPSVVPTITATKSGTGSTGVTSGGCATTDRLGNTLCSLTATLPGTYTISVTSPVQVSSAGTITVVQYPRSMAFTTQPSTTGSGGVDLVQQPVVTVYDKAGNVMPSAGNVTLSLTSATSTSGGTAVLSATTNPVAVGVLGTATFAGVDITLNGSYTITASLVNATSGTITVVSTAVAITSGVATQLRFAINPSSTGSSDVALLQAPVVGMADAFGNPVASGNCIITLSMTGGEVGDTLRSVQLTRSLLVPNSGVNAGYAVADFSTDNLRVRRIGTTLTALSYNLVATANAPCAGLTAATSTAFSITLAGVPAQLGLAQAPSVASLNETWLNQPIVNVLDLDGNLVTGDNTTVVTIAKDAVSPAASVLSGTSAVQAQNGVVTFVGLSVPATTAQAAYAGTYYWDFTGVNASTPLAITSLQDVSQVINTNGLVPAGLQFRVQPANKGRNEPNVSIEVKVVDASGNFCFNDNASEVQLAFTSGTGLAYQNDLPLPQGGGTITADADVVNGIATFSGIDFDTIGTKVLRAQGGAASPALTTVNSASFTISAYVGPADHLTFTPANGGVQPADTAGTAAGTPWTTQPKVAVNDVYGNVDTSDNSTIVHLNCTPTALACVLLGTTSVKVINGVATFTDLRIGSATASIVLGASSTPALPIPATQSSPSFSEN